MQYQQTIVIPRPTGPGEVTIPFGGDGTALVGRQLGEYLLTRQFRGGGMAWVYEATCPKWPRPLVVKMPAGGQLSSTEARQRFRREIATAKALSHASIVGVVDEGECDGVPYLVMNLVEGQTLLQWVGSENPTVSARLSKFEELCKTMAAVHQEGKMHRDLKPENIMVDKHGTLRLLDFGLARSLEESSGLTQEGTVLGTPSCMAPEQTGTGKAIGPQADVYALGCILTWLLTGHYPVPLHGLSRQEILVAIELKPPLRICALNEAAPAALENLALRCLEKDPALRPNDASELLQRLTHVMAEVLFGYAPWLQSRAPFGTTSDSATAPQASPRISTRVETAGGAVPLHSPFYVERGGDREFLDALVRAESVVLVHGPRQIGKTSLLARGLHSLRRTGRKVVLVDYQAINSEVLSTLKSLYLHLAAEITEQLELESALADTWDDRRAANTNFERFLTRAVLPQVTSHLVWAMDEVDRVFPCGYCSELFGMFRSWHNARSLNPDGPWGRLSLAMAYAAEAKLFITDLNQSPFNIGIQVRLEDFTFEDVADLNRRYENPLKDPDEIRHLQALIGGHPFLLRTAFN